MTALLLAAFAMQGNSSDDELEYSATGAGAGRRAGAATAHSDDDEDDDSDSESFGYVNRLGGCLRVVTCGLWAMWQ